MTFTFGVVLGLFALIVGMGIRSTNEGVTDWRQWVLNTATLILFVTAWGGLLLWIGVL